MAKQQSYQSIVRDSAYYQRLGMEVELDRLQKQADDIRLQLRRYPAHILERARISELRNARTATPPSSGGGNQQRTGGARYMSAAARKRISDAQKARWAKHRATHGGQSPAPGATEGDGGAVKRAGRTRAAGRGRRKRTLSPEARKRIADAQRRRWARYRRQKA
jgi:hypothetical protein